MCNMFILPHRQVLSTLVSLKIANMANGVSFLFSICFFFLLITKSQSVYVVSSYGAKGDGRTDSTTAFLKAWHAACSASGSAAIYVPGGSYLVGPVKFEGPCRSSRIDIRIDGTIVAPGYQRLANVDRWLAFHSVQGVSIYGGTLDGRGAALWSCKASHHGCPSGAASLGFMYSRNILVSDLTSMNSELAHIALNSCNHCKVQGVRIQADGNSPNTDGIHVQESVGVTIVNTNIKTGDDCISIGPGTKSLFVEGVSCGPGHGISIGSLGKSYNEDGVENVTVRSVLFSGSDNGVRIKSWGRPTKGFVRGVTFEHAVMRNVENPIIIDQNYCPHEHGCPGQSSGIKISGVTYNDIRGTSASEVAVKFDCSQSSPCNGIELQDIKLTYQNRPAESACSHVHGQARGLQVPPSCL